MRYFHVHDYTGSTHPCRESSKLFNEFESALGSKAQLFWFFAVRGDRLEGGSWCCSLLDLGILDPRSIWTGLGIICSKAIGIACPLTWFFVEWWFDWPLLRQLSCHTEWVILAVASPFQWELAVEGPFTWNIWKGLTVQIQRPKTWYF